MSEANLEKIRGYNDAVLVCAYRNLLCRRHACENRETLQKALSDEIERRGIDLDNFNGANGFGTR